MKTTYLKNSLVCSNIKTVGYFGYNIAAIDDEITYSCLSELSFVFQHSILLLENSPCLVLCASLLHTVGVRILVVLTSVS